MKRLSSKHLGEEHSFWMSYTDLMSGFLIVFIISSAILYRTQIGECTECQRLHIELEEKEHIIDSIQHNDLRNLINKYKDVFIQDKNILVEFDTIRGSIILTNRDVTCDLFAKGDEHMGSELRKYIDTIGSKIVKKTMVLWKENNCKDVEVRIEGHTDPTWGDERRGSSNSFIENLSLSSKRSNNVYQHILQNTGLIPEEQEFVKKNMISIGYSFSVRAAKGNINVVSEDPASRRIEFRIISK